MIRKFNDFSINEEAKDNSFVDNLKRDVLDITGYDKDKYDGVDEATAEIKWDETISYKKGGIEGIQVVVSSLKFKLTYEPKEGEPIEEDLVIDLDNVEVVKGQKLIPLYAEHIDLDVAKKTAIVYFGRD